jgi:hypothetical protein
MSLEDTPDLAKHIDLIKLTFFTDEEYIYKFFDSRVNNSYVQSVKSKILKSGSVDKDIIGDILKINKLKSKVKESHHNSINWENLSDDHGHIEFRYLGGKDYHKKWDKIRTIIGQYSYNLSLACDPDFKKKEYLKKVIRLIGKIELRYAEYRLTVVEDVIKHVNDWESDNKPLIKWLDKYYKEVKKKRDMLKTIHGKLDKRIQIGYKNEYAVMVDMADKIQKFKPNKIVTDWLMSY